MSVYGPRGIVQDVMQPASRINEFPTISAEGEILHQLTRARVAEALIISALSVIPSSTFINILKPAT